MRTLPILLLLLLLSACCSPTAKVPTTEEAQQREAEALVRASLTDRLVADTVTYYRGQAAAVLTDQGIPPEEADARAMATMEPLLAAEHQRLVEALAPIFRRHYTAAEIHQLLSFYRTEVARKSREVSALIAAEGQQFVRRWSENFGEEFLKRIDAETGGER